MNNRLLIPILAAVAVVGVYWFLVLSPKREEASKLADEVAARQEQLTQARATLANHQTAQKTYKRNYATVARLGKAVPEDDDVRSLIVQIERAASKTGVGFESLVTAGGAGEPGSSGNIPPGASVGDAGFLTMPFNFKFRGEFFELGEFLARIERFVEVSGQRIDVTGRLLVLNTIDLKTELTGFPNINAEIKATTYMLPSDQGLSGGATPAGPAGAATPPGTAPGTPPPGDSADSAETNTAIIGAK